MKQLSGHSSNTDTIIHAEPVCRWNGLLQMWTILWHPKKKSPKYTIKHPPPHILNLLPWFGDFAGRKALHIGKISYLLKPPYLGVVLHLTLYLVYFIGSGSYLTDKVQLYWSPEGKMIALYK